MIKNKTIKLCLVLLVFSAVFQLVLFCQSSLNGETVASLEQAIKEEERKNQQLIMALAEKSNLDQLNEYAKNNKFLPKPTTLVFSSQQPFAYNW